MKEKLLTRLLLLLTLSTLILCLSSCSNSNSKFTGSKVSNDNQFIADFEVLNMTVDSTISLKKGDTMDTTINIKNGAVNIVVKNEKGTVAYQGDNVESGSFSIGITEDGTYTFSITGSKAKGSVHFVKRKNN